MPRNVCRTGGTCSGGRRRTVAAGRDHTPGIPSTDDSRRAPHSAIKTLFTLRRYLRDILLTDEDEITGAMRLVWERMKIIIEPSSAVPLAAVLRHPEIFSKARVGIILSGGNVDASVFFDALRSKKHEMIELK